MSSSTAVQIDANHWCTGPHVCCAFRVLRPPKKGSTTPGEPVDAWEYLEAFTKTLHDALVNSKVSERAALFYRSVPVQMSLLDDPAAVPTNPEVDAAVDQWQLIYLALQLQHKKALTIFTRFHSDEAVSVLEDLAAEAIVEEEEMPAPAAKQPSVDQDDVRLEDDRDSSNHRCSPSPDPVSSIASRRAATQDLIECLVRTDWGGSLVLLGPCPTTSSPAAAAAAAAAVKSQSRPGQRRFDPADAEMSHSLPGVHRPVLLEEDAEVVQRRNSRLLEMEEAFFREEEGFCAAQVLYALRPLIISAVAGLRQEEEQQAEGRSTSPSSPNGVVTTDAFALIFLRDYCSCFMELLNRPALLVDAGMVFDICEGDIALFNKLLELFQGSLTPIFRGKKISSGEGTRSLLNSIAPSPANPSLLSTPRGSMGRHSAAAGGQARQVPFWLSCAPQEAQRAALYAVWITYREQASEKPGSARGRRVADILNEYRLTLAGTKKLRDVRSIPPASIWSGHLFILAKLTSRDCTVEDFMDVVGEGSYLSVLASNGIPGIVVAVLAASLIAAELIAACEPGGLRLLCGKLDTLLVDLPSRPNALRTYLNSNIASHAERFEELWLGATPYSEPKKFQSRAELLFFTTCEIVFLAAERTWPTLAKHDPKEVAQLESALQSWLHIWKNFLHNVKTRPQSVHRRTVSRSGAGSFAPVTGMNSGMASLLDTSPRASQNLTASAHIPPLGTSPSLAPKDSPAPPPNVSITTTAADSDNEMAEQNDALKRICEAMPLRMQHGKAPLPALRLSLFPEPGSSSSANAPSPLVADSMSDSNVSSRREDLRSTASNSTSSPNKLPTSSLEHEFDYVQQCFGQEAGQLSNEVKLKFYGLYKQSTIGDVNCARPWLVDAVGRAKWDAWNKLKGMSTMDAKRMYINEYKIMKQLGEAK